MKSRSLVVATAIVLFCAMVSLAQEPLRGPDYRNAFKPSTRLMFEQQGLPQVCFAVDDSGKYQLQKRTRTGASETLVGTLDAEQSKKLKTLLENPEFLTVDQSRGAGLLRSGNSETFTAELPTSAKSGMANSKFVRAIDIDGQSPFPPAIRNVVDWLKNFSPGSARPEDATQTCPAVGTQPASSQ